MDGQVLIIFAISPSPSFAILLSISHSIFTVKSSVILPPKWQIVCPFVVCTSSGYWRKNVPSLRAKCYFSVFLFFFFFLLALPNQIAGAASVYIVYCVQVHTHTLEWRIHKAKLLWNVSSKAPAQNTLFGIWTLRFLFCLGYGAHFSITSCIECGLHIHTASIEFHSIGDEYLPRKEVNFNYRLWGLKCFSFFLFLLTH